MANQKDAPLEFKEGPAAESVISLSQALLAPLDAIFKAQIHAARSFLNLLLQIGYPHQRLEGMEETESTPDSGASEAVSQKEPIQKDTPYTLDFYHEVTIDSKKRRQRIRVPALALVPITPLSVESAEFSFDMAVRGMARHKQMQPADEKNLKDGERWTRSSRPWYLIDDPVSVRGVLASPASADGAGATSKEAVIHISVKVSRVNVPSGLDKLLTSLTQITELADVESK